MKTGVRIQNKRVSIFIWLGRFFIVLCLLDGFLDVIYPATKGIIYYINIINKEMYHPANPEPGSVEDVVVNVPGQMHKLSPEIPGLFKELHTPKVNIAADGMRSNGQPIPKKVTSSVYVFGSSPAWGYGIADSQTLAAHLERDLDHARVKNYAGWSQTLTGNILRWYDITQNKKHLGLVLIAGGSTDIYLKCAMQSIPYKSTNIFLYTYEKIVRKITGAEFLCSSERNTSLIVENAILDLQSAVAYGRRKKTPFYIVYLPTPYEENVNVHNLEEYRAFRVHFADLRHAYKLYHSALKNLQIPELIDLSQALPENKTYFLDPEGHMSGNANRILAAKIAERIQKDYPTRH